MIVPAADLKLALKKLSPVKTGAYRWGPGGVIAQSSDVLIAAAGPSFPEAFNVDGKKLTQVVNRMSGQIDIERSDNKITLKSGKAKSVDLEVHPVKPAPLPDVAKNGLTFSLPELKKALSLSAATASPAKSQKFGGCVQIQNLPLGIEDSNPPGYRVVGTDSKVLTVAAVEKPVGYEFKWLLNLEAAAAVQLMDGDVVVIGDSPKALSIRSKDALVFASKPVQAYPNFDKFLSFRNVVKYGLNVEELRSALRTVEPLIDEDVDQGVISLLFKDGVIQCSSVGVGSVATDEASYEQLEPDPVFDPAETSVLITAKYLSGFLSKAEGPASFSITKNPDSTNPAENPIKMESNGTVVFAMPCRGKK